MFQSIVNKVIEQKFSCCNQDSKSEGCEIGKHVYDGNDYETDQPLVGYVQTKASTQNQAYNIYALDCEMVWYKKQNKIFSIKLFFFVYSFKVLYNKRS